MNSTCQVRIARFEEPDETREVYLVPSTREGLHILQFSWGAVTRLAYGADAICHRLTLGERALTALCGLLGAQGSPQSAFARFFSDEDAALVDLLDICDRAGIPYTFCSVNGTSGAMSRRCEAVC